jgi:hypothetical protein
MMRCWDNAMRSKYERIAGKVERSGGKATGFPSKYTSIREPGLDERRRFERMAILCL